MLGLDEQQLSHLSTAGPAHGNVKSLANAAVEVLSPEACICFTAVESNRFWLYMNNSSPTSHLLFLPHGNVKPLLYPVGEVLCPEACICIMVR